METGEPKLRVDPTPIAADGSKLEPEERTATEAIPLPIDVTLADHAVRPDAPEASTSLVGELPGVVGIESTAGEVAQDVSTRCELCVHWRREDWLKHLAAIEDTSVGRREIDAMRGQLLGRSALQSINGVLVRSEDVTEEDYILVSIAIRREFAICAVFTETSNDVCVTPFYGGCPVDDNRFKMRDREAQAIASAGYDRVLRMAQGRE